MGDYQLFHGDCLEILPTLEAGSVDAVITDPPYGLGFMGKDWDHGVPGERFWAEVLRVAKPGAFLLAFGGTRTFHRLAVAIEDAGWEIRDTINYLHDNSFAEQFFFDSLSDEQKSAFLNLYHPASTVGWCYGSGFPKSLDISKAIDKAAGAVREVVGRHKGTVPNITPRPSDGDRYSHGDGNITAPATDAARQWSGWGTALKPAWEPIIVARKPLCGTVAENVLKHGTGGINVDGCRVATDDVIPKMTGKSILGGSSEGWDRPWKNDPDGLARRQAAADAAIEKANTLGRWPANLIHDGSDEVVGLFPANVKGGTWNRTAGARHFNNDGEPTGYQTSGSDGSTGSAARFFYCAKASKADRDAGLEGEGKKQPTLSGGNGIEMVGPHDVHPKKNHHPTVKPIELMRYLCKLTATPTGGVVLDPFMGSGSTGVAAIREGRDFVGIEMDAEYLEIARRRIEHAAQMAAGQFVDKRGKAGDTEDLPLFGVAN